MFLKKDQTWLKYIPEFEVDTFNNSLFEMKLHSKCVNANVYAPIEELGEVRTYVFETLSVVTDITGNLVLFNIPKYQLPYLLTSGYEWQIKIENHSVPALNTIFTITDLTRALNGQNYDFTLIGSIFPISLSEESVKITLTRQEDTYRDLGWLEYGYTSLEDYHYGLKSHFTPKKSIDNLLENFRIVDLASTENLAINVLLINPVVDGYVVRIGHRVLLKNQDNPIENGIYLYTSDRKLIRETELETLSGSYQASYHVKLGTLYREKQFFLQRKFTNARFPIDGEEMFFEEGHNYLLRHKLEYRNLADAEFEDVDFHFNGTGFETNYAVGEYGLLLRRQQMTSVVENIELGTRERLYAINLQKDSLYIPTGNMWVCGKRGTMYHSDDSGVTWIKQNPNTTQDLLDVEFSDDTFGLAVGALGTVIWSNTGGSSWNDISFTTEDRKKNLNAIKFIATNKAIVIGDRGLFFIMTHINGNWTVQQVEITKQEDLLTSYVINDNLKEVTYDPITRTAYVVGEEKTIFSIDMDVTSLTYLEVFFYETTNISHVNEHYYTCKWKPDDSYMIFAGDSEIVYRTNFTGFTLLTDSNIYQISTDFDSSITPIFTGKTPTRINSVQPWFEAALNNHYYIAGDNGFFGDSPQLSAYAYDSYYDIGLFVSRLLVLDAKIADKMYFLDNDGEVVLPKVLTDIGSSTVVDYIDMSNADFDTLYLFSSSTKTFLDYQDYYATVPHDRLFESYDPTLTDVYDYGVNGVGGYFDVTSGGNTTFIFYDNQTELVLNDDIFTVAAGENIRVQIYDYTLTLLFLDETFLVTSISGSSVFIDDVFDDQFKNDLFNAATPYRMKVTNLNHYPVSGTTQNIVESLIDRMSKHSVGLFYDFKLYDQSPNVGLIVKVKNVPWTKYINGQTYIDYFSNFTTLTTNYSLEYEESVLSFKYYPRHNLLDVLNTIDGVTFLPTYAFNMPQNVFVYESSPLVPTQFVFNGHTIVMGSSFQSWYDAFYVNTFVDIIHNGANTLRTRALLMNKYVTVESGVTRYHFVFDFDLQSYVPIYSIVTTDTIDIRSRNLLSEVSEDLRYADDRQLDIFYTSLTHVVTPKNFHNGLQSFYTDSYARIISEEKAIRDVTSGIIYTDDRKNLAFNLFDISGDPNFNFQPVDIYDVGIDLEPKNAISLTPFNMENFFVPSTLIGHYGLKLFDIDFKKYNFRLVDGLTLPTLSSKYPWVLEAEIENAVIGEDSNGLVWYTGDWICGTWKDGTWYSGRFFDGIWVMGTWHSREIQDRIFSVLVKSNESLTYSQWFNGTWISGTWNNGTWYNGTWQTGTWLKGHWLDGTWYDGRWYNGTWKGGDWINGVWYNGYFNTDNVFSTWYNGFWFGGDFENGLWKNGEFNQLRGSRSRFGTKSTAQQKSTWEHGVFIQGEFHSFLNLDVNGNPSPSVNYKHSTWLAGRWKNGSVYGGTFNQGVWEDGVWYRGYVNGGLALTPVSLVQDPPLSSRWLFTLTPTVSHKLFVGDEIYIIGTPNNMLPTSSFMTYFGLNNDPKNHKVYDIETNGDIVIEIIDPGFIPLLADIDCTNSGYVDLFSVFTVLENDWKGGIFNNGLWLYGTWYGGMWVDGIWDNGVWMDPSVPAP